MLFSKKQTVQKTIPLPGATTGGIVSISEKLDPLDTEIDLNAKYVEPPLDLDELAKLYNQCGLHRACIILKAQAISIGYKPHQANKNYMEKPGDNASKGELVDYVESRQQFQNFLSREQLYKMCLDYIIHGNCGLEHLFPRGGEDKIAGLRYRNFRGIRVGTNPNIFYQVKNGEIVETFNESFLYLNMPSPESDYYGLPEYLPAYDDVQLLVSATNLRRTFYSKNGYLGGVLAMNVPVDDEDDEGNSKTEQNWANNVIEAVTKNGEKIWLFNLRGNQDIEDVSKAIHFFSLAQTLKDDDFKSSVEAALQNILYVHRTDPDLIGAVRGEGGVANLEKVKQNYSDTVIDFHQDKIELAINSVVDPENWITFDRFFKTDQKAESKQDEKAETKT